uniref:Uncharacterized protein n=1 Tax=Sipha flava TaxID=143950 RepID=A0A2S2QYY3_9HEMI
MVNTCDLRSKIIFLCKVKIKACGRCIFIRFEYSFTSSAPLVQSIRRDFFTNCANMFRICCSHSRTHLQGCKKADYRLRRSYAAWITAICVLERSAKSENNPRAIRLLQSLAVRAVRRPGTQFFVV